MHGRPGVTILFILSLAGVNFNVCLAAGKAAQFLNAGIGPRSIGMGELGAALPPDGYSAYWNPARLAYLEQAQMTLMHNRHFADMEQQYFSYAHPFIHGNTLAINAMRFGVKPFAAYNAQGISIGSVDAESWAASIAYGGPAFFPELGFGANLKWIRERLGPSAASAPAADIGLHYQFRILDQGPLSGHFRLGAALSNLGPRLGFDHEKFALPQIGRLGIAYEHLWRGSPLLVSAEGVFPRGSNPRFGFGAEYLLGGVAAVRFGFRSHQDIGSGWRAGFGFKLKDLIFDYAWAGFGAFGATHRFGLTIHFPQRRGAALSKQGLFGTAPVLENKNETIKEKIRNAQALYRAMAVTLPVSVGGSEPAAIRSHQANNSVESASQAAKNETPMLAWNPQLKLDSTQNLGILPSQKSSTVPPARSHFFVSSKYSSFESRSNAPTGDSRLGTRTATLPAKLVIGFIILALGAAFAFYFFWAIP